MSETLSAEELAYLNEMHGPDYPVNTLPPVRRMLATIEALQAEVTTLRTALLDVQAIQSEYDRKPYLIPVRCQYSLYNLYLGNLLTERSIGIPRETR